jgi:ribosomal protein L37AE/L43A
MPETTTHSTSTQTQEAMQNLVSCPKCGEDNAEGTRYCDNCGTSLAGALASQSPKASGTQKGFFARLFGRRS